MSKHATFENFELYSRALIVSKDVDPVYPVVKWLIKNYKFNPEWFVFCYVAFYSLESAIKMCRVFPSHRDWDPQKFRHLRKKKELSKFGHERRGSCRNIDNQILMFKDIIELIHGLDHYNKDELDNPGFREGIKTAAFHGDWAAYKIAELFEKSLGYDSLKIHDLGLEGKDPNRNDGPVGGLRWLYGRENKYSTDIYPTWDRFGANLAKAWGVDVGEVETCLCKWHKMCTGKYWIGHDIAEFIELRHVMGNKDYADMMDKLFNPVFWADLKTFPKVKKKTFLETGELENSGFARKLPQIDVFDILMNTD